MAPVTPTTTGVPQHPIDDPGLVLLLERLRSYDCDNDNDCTNTRSSDKNKNGASDNDDSQWHQDHDILSPSSAAVDIEGLVGELERFHQWRFGEQTDLFQWTKPLNAMDSALRKMISDFPVLFLIAPVVDESETKDTKIQTPVTTTDAAATSSTSSPTQTQTQAESEDEADSVPPSIKHAISTILRFLASLLRNSYNKAIFNSVKEVTDLLAAADDDIASQALEVLSCLSLPTQGHRLSVPDTNQSGTALHNYPSLVTHARLMMLAKGWGSRENGLGLATIVATDDSPSGQGSLPQYAGEVRYEFLPPSSTKVIKIHLSTNDICLKHIPTSRTPTSGAGLEAQLEKRRKVTAASTVGGGGPASSETQPTAHLFFQCLEQIGGRSNIAPERLFDLLVHIRLAKSFHSRSARIAGVETRLRALLTILYAHPSHDILAGYFHAQPELCVELTDLVRPTVSQSAVSSSGSMIRSGETGENDVESEIQMKQAVIESIVDPSSEIPYEIRTLAVEVLTALVGRKDDGSNGSTHVARQANVLGELGVGKGQFLGLLPTLIRYSLASLKSFVTHDTGTGTDAIKNEIMKTSHETKTGDNDVDMVEEDDFGLELGLAFISATKPQFSLGQEEGEEKALEFISCVLSLAFSVVNVSSGTAALTDCGLVPALVSTMALNDGTDNLQKQGSESYAATLFKFIIAQSMQLLEGAITNNTQALSAFHELNGIEILVTRLSAEIKLIKMQNLTGNEGLSNKMAVDDEGSSMSEKFNRNLQGSNRVLMYSILNCLTVVFHLQETSSRSSSFPLTQGVVLRRNDMTDVLIEIMDNVSIYSGVLASLVITFLGDAMNSDPRVVHYVYECGLADSFFKMLKSNTVSDKTSKNGICPVDSESWHEPMIPASPELIVALPNVITALALTEDGRKKLAEVNPIPDILGILCSPRFAMPISRCMSGDLASMMGSGIDELMRHVPSLKGLVVESIVSLIQRVVFVGKALVKEELIFERNNNCRNRSRSHIEDHRIQFMQYSHNVGQVLEQVFQNDEHCAPFADAGGVESLIQMHPLLMPSGKQFLAHISTQSSPSVAILTHSTTARTITTAIGKVASNNNLIKVLKKAREGLSNGLESLEASISDLRRVTGEGKESSLHELSCAGILEDVPRVPLHLLLEDESNPSMITALACFLRDIINIEWMTQLLSSVVKMAFGTDIGTRGKNECQDEMSSEGFQTLLSKLDTVYRYSIYEVCRIRTEEDIVNRDNKRWLAPGDSNYHPAIYRLRIVCNEGAVVRDGIDIDSCANVGVLEMGEEVEAFDRCVNGSGIMRYRTAKGWVSEQTRGHGREPISEVLEVHGVAPKRHVPLKKDPKTKKAIDCGIPDLCTASASILARLQNSQCYLYTFISRAVIVGFKTLANRLPNRTAFSSQENINNAEVSLIARGVSNFLRSNFDLTEAFTDIPEDLVLNDGGETMYLGNMLNILHCCIYDDRGRQETLNLLIFCNLVIHSGLSDAFFIPKSQVDKKEDTNLPDLPHSGFYGAIRTVLRYGITDMAKDFCGDNTTQSHHKMITRQSKIVASSFPTALSLIKRLISPSLSSIDAQTLSYLTRMDGKGFISFIVGDVKEFQTLPNNNFFSFRSKAFSRSVHCTIALIAEELWSDPNLKFIPPHVLNPILSLMTEVFLSLEKSNKDGTENNEESRRRPNQIPSSWTRRGIRVTAVQRGVERSQQAEAESEEVPPPPPASFQPSEETVQRMVEMGFSREHALHAIESSQSNIVESAMEYALSHPQSLRERSQQRSSTSETAQPNTQNNVGNSIDETTEGLEDMDEADAKTPEDTKTEKIAIKVEKKLTEAEIKELAEKDFDAKQLVLVQKCLQQLKESIVDNAIILIEGSIFVNENNLLEEKVVKGLQSDSEVVNVVVCNFLLDLCHRYPVERSRMVTKILEQLKSHLELDTKGNHMVMNGKEEKFAAMCHAAVIFLRALPRTRSLALKQDIVSAILQCLRAFSSKLRHSRVVDQKMWPCWLSPSILVIDVMSQPVSLEDDESNLKNNSDSSLNRGDYTRVIAEHKRQQIALTKMSKRISTAIEKSKGSNKKLKQKESKKSDVSTAEASKELKKNDRSTAEASKESKKSDRSTAEAPKETASERTHPFANIPTFSPLVTQDMSESFLATCLQIFRYQQKKNETKDCREFYIPSSITHALLIVLSKILRSQRLASSCLRMGCTELLLSLQNKSRFKGHVSLITLSLRRMIEDESTLQTIMESEIRSAVTKLMKKKTRSSSTQPQKISTRSFVESVSTLICRDPIVFLKAATTSIKVEPDPSNPDVQLIVSLPADERARNSKALTEFFRSNNQNNTSHCTNHTKSTVTTPTGNKRGRQQKTKQSQKNLKSKSPHRGSRKALKKEKQDKIITVMGSAANHVTSQLLTTLLKHHQAGETITNLPFLSLKELLEIIGDLVHSVPACAAAIHSYQPINGSLVIRHALRGCQPPSLNIVNFLLHELLSHPRMLPEKARELDKELCASNETQLKESFMKTKVSQFAARLLVMLVARAGEGRRRVILELSNALRGNDSENNHSLAKDESVNDDREMWALSSWGELCIGLAAPRRVNPTHDTDSTLSLEVVKVMQECGMTHALMNSIKRIKLYHPLAAATAAALLRPLENFTRPSVIDAVKLMAKKAEKKMKQSSKVDDSALEDGFDVDAENRNLPWLYNDHNPVNPMVETDDANDEDVDMENSFDEMEDDSMIMSEEQSEDDESESSESSDSDESDDNDSDDTSSDDESDDDDSDEETDYGAEDEIEIEIEDDGDEDDEIDIEEAIDNGDTDDDFFDGDEEVEEMAEIDGDFDEGWTNIEAGLGNMFGSRNGIASIGRPRTNGGSAFMIEAAETMIGNILRSGGLHVDAVAEIEDTLGIRVATSNHPPGSEQLRPRTIINLPGELDVSRLSRLRTVGDLSSSHRSRPSNPNDENLSSHNRGPVGTTPTINQRGLPDNYFISIGSSVRNGEVNYMEYQFGGPPLGPTRVFYDLSDSDPLEEDAHSVDELLRTPSSFDVQLFPSGSAASTHSRPSHRSHPLVSAINLPPSNALISLPSRQREDGRHSSRSGDNRDRNWSEIRLGRGGGVNIFDRTTGHGGGRGMHGWTDDGLPVDNTTADFCLAFEQALTHTIMNSTPTQPSTENNDNSTNALDQENPNERQARNNNQETESSNEVTSSERMEENEGTAGSNSNVTNEESNVSDGENVASSLAASLTLSTNEQSNNTSNNMVEQNDNMEDANDSTNNDDLNDNSEIISDPNNNDEPDNNTDHNDEPINNDEPSGDIETSNNAINSEESNNISEIITEPTNDDEPNDQAEHNIESVNNEETNNITEGNTQPTNDNGPNALICPPGVDVDVFSQLPIEMQQEIVDQHETTESTAAQNVAAQLDATSGLDPEALAALPEDMRREVIQQEQNERRLRNQEETPADPSNAEEMDNASFIASLTPELRRDILMTSDDMFLNTLPPDIIAEAQVLRERAASSRHRRDVPPPERHDNSSRRGRTNPSNENVNSAQTRSTTKKRNKTGKIRVEIDRDAITFRPMNCDKDYGPLVTPSSIKPLLSLMYLLSPVRPQKLLQKLFQNFSANSDIRRLLTKAFVALLNDDPALALTVINSIAESHLDEKNIKVSSSNVIDAFPPSCLLGTAPDIDDTESADMSLTFFRRRHGSGTAAAIASNLPLGARCSASEKAVPSVVAGRVIGTLTFLTKNSGKTSLDILNNFGNGADMTCLDNLIGLLGKQTYSQSSSNLEDLLNLIESICVPLSSIPGDNDNYVEVTKKDIDLAADAGKEWIDVPRAIVSPQKLHLLCRTLRLESCKNGVFVKVNNIARRLCKVIANRDCILQELASVAQALGTDAIRDLRALRLRLNKAVESHRDLLNSDRTTKSNVPSIPSTTVTLSTSSSELKLLRVLQTLHSLCAVLTDENGNKRSDGSLVVREELVSLISSVNLGPVWDQLTACLHVVSILEGVSDNSEEEENSTQNEDDNEKSENSKKLQNSVAGLLSRFLPTIEAFFVVNASTIATSTASKKTTTDDDDDLQNLVGGRQLIDFVATNKVLINAIVRSSPSLLDKGLRAMVRIPKCRPFMDFDVKRQWFRTQVRRLRQQASRRHGSLRLTIRRQHVFEDAYHQLRPRDADEMRGRLHITFVNEEGVDAGGLSREFFGILAKEMFNPNYALFTSTEDGCTFQPNPHSTINPDHLSYFRFVGRIVGKAVADGFLLDAHFTRSLYKHMSGMKPTYHDMEAIDPDYYKNLKMILEYNLEDIGLELTFSTETHSFGRSQTIDLIPNGRNIKVKEETKEKYVSLVCQHRMTTSIKDQIKAYLDGFYELVKPDLISIFNAKELELLISGMPDIDIHDLKKNTDYQGYRASDKEIGWFWNIMFSLNKSEKAAFLQFTTGSSKVPLNGFSELQGMRGIQKFSIHKVGGGKEGALMSSHTCFNSLDLPVYQSEEIMKEKLLLAIKEGGGAFLFS